MNDPVPRRCAHPCQENALPGLKFCGKCLRYRPFEAPVGTLWLCTSCRCTYLIGRRCCDVSTILVDTDSIVRGADGRITECRASAKRLSA